MLISQIKKKYHLSLSGLYPKEEISSLFELAAENCLGMSLPELHLNMGKNTSPEAEIKMDSVLNRLIIAEPIQYILGSCSFYDLSLKTKPGVLIPRQETEYLVDLIVNELNPSNTFSLIDICCGSGCIAVALAKNLNNSLITAMDISQEALELSVENAATNDVKINFIKDDLLFPKLDYNRFDIIVSNPPYVRNSEKEKMHKNILDFEPHLALFVEDKDPLIFYRAIADFALRHLNPNGKIFLEINESLGNEMLFLFQEKSFKDVEILKDLNGKNRYLKCKLY